jgi:uncharacterized membrane protein SpoIIM required for sporulation
LILDLERFANSERPHWDALERILKVLEEDPGHRLSLAESKRLFYLYQRTSSDLAQVQSFAGDNALRAYLESLVSRAYGEIQETPESRLSRVRPFRWFFKGFPRAFRRRIGVFYLAASVTAAGCLFGSLAVALDPAAKAALMPFPQLLQNPVERVQHEEKEKGRELRGRKSTFSAGLMTHNIRVAFLNLALGITWGLGTLILLFYNGVILGAVFSYYILYGETAFVFGWLLPHGVIEIPAFLIAGQAGLVMAGALIGRGSRKRLGERLREVMPDLVTLVAGVAVMLVWAGFIEAFLSQYHEPVLPYGFKIGFGILELGALVFFLTRMGRSEDDARSKREVPP